MGKVNKPATGSNGQQAPLEPVDFLGDYLTVDNSFSDVTVESTLNQTKFDPREYEYADNPSSLDIGTEKVSAARQPIGDLTARTLKQFGANVLGAIATSAMNTADVKETFNILSNKETDFNTSLFGVSTKDIMDWTRGVAEDNKIYENEVGNFDMSDPGWWANQVASAGTGVGMAAYALGETALIAAATEGLGAIPEMFENIRKFPQLMRLLKTVKNGKQATELADIATRLKRTATTYAIMNRLNESKMEAQQTFHDSFDELRAMRNEDGTQKYTEEQARDAAAAGARRDFLWNMPLMALDIMTYRMMVYNPFSGAGQTALEKGLSKVAGKLSDKFGTAGKALGWTLPHLVGSTTEGIEEGLQYVGGDEGKHYARVMAGLDDRSTFMQRLGTDVTSDEFWNNFAGGVIGSPIIGGTMKLFNKAVNGRAQKRLSQLHNDFVNNIGQMDSALGDLIRNTEASGDMDLAKVYRRNFGANKALSALYLDALKGSAAGFDAYKNFLDQTLNEINQGNTESLKDLGFTAPTAEQIEQIKTEFQTYLQDADKMKNIFDQVSNQHEKQFIAPISQQMFSLQTRRENQSELLARVDAARRNVFGFDSLSPRGKELHDVDYRLIALNAELMRLKKLKDSTANPAESYNISLVMEDIEQEMAKVNNHLNVVNADENYTKQQRDSDASILKTPAVNNDYLKAVMDSVKNNVQINLEGRDLALWSDRAYKNEQSILGIINSRTVEQLDDMEADLTMRGKMTSNIQEAIDNKRKKLRADEAVAEIRNRRDDVANPTSTNPITEEANQANPNTASPVNPEQSQQVQDYQESVLNFEEQPEQLGFLNEYGEEISAGPLDQRSPDTVEGNFDLFSDAINIITTVATEQASQAKPVKEIKPEELTMEQLRALPSDNPEVTENALAILPTIDFTDPGSINKGTSDMLSIVNNKYIPVDKIIQVLKTKAKLIGNNEYMSKDYLEKYIHYTTKNFENLENIVTDSNRIDFNYGDKLLSKTTVTNLDSLLEESAGRVQTTYDGDKVRFSSFDVQIYDDNTAVITELKTKPETEKFAVVVAARLGQDLQSKGIVLTFSEGDKEVEAVWEALERFGYATKHPNSTYTFNKQLDQEFNTNPTIEISLAPVTINDNLTQDQKQRLKDAVAILLKDNSAPSFEDLVRSAINQSDMKTADQTFNLLIRGWELNGYTPVNYAHTYTKIFEDPIGSLKSLLGELGVANDDTKPQSVVQAQVASEGAQEDAINNQNKPTDFDNNGQPIYNYTGIVTEESNKKFAFLSVPYRETITIDDEGVTVDRENVLGDINEGDHINSLRLLDPNKYIPGTKMDVMVPPNFRDIKITIYNPDGSRGRSITFGQYVIQNNLTPDMQAYKDAIPMIIYDKGRTSDKGVAFIHDVSWYNPVNFNATRRGEMEEAIQATREMRDEVLKSNGKPVGITITSKRETTFSGLKVPDGKTISLKQANPTATITVAKGIDTLTVDGKNPIFDGQLMNTKPFAEGLAYDVRQTGRRNGEPVYTAFPLIQPELDDVTKDSIILVLKAFINAKNPGLSNGDKAVFDAVHSQILATSSIDIRSTRGIVQYLNQFIHLFNGDNVNSVEDAEAQLRARGKKDGYKYITVNSAGGIIFGTLGTPMAPKRNGFFANPNPNKNNIAGSFQIANGIIDNIRKTNFLTGYQQHVHFGSLNNNKPVVQFDKERAPIVSLNYKDFLMNRLQTDMRSINIGTDTNPNYVTNVQPIITYESDSKLNSISSPITVSSTVEEVVPAVQTVVAQRAEVNIEAAQTTPKDDQSSIEALRKSQLDLINQAKEELGLDYLTEEDVMFNEDSNLAPVELDDIQKGAIAESVKRIAGLNPQQQTELVDFMYNQVVALIDIDNKEGVSKNEVYEKVRENFDKVIKPLRKSYADKVRQLKNMLDVDPQSPHAKDLRLAIASYNRSINRINDIQENYELLEEETQQRVEKYTNISSKVKENLEEDEESSEGEDTSYDDGDGSAEREKEFGSDSLSDNPDGKLTYAMRRFFGQIRKVDREGNPALGFLRLPVYVGSDTVANTLRDLLADVPSDFNTMMDKLEKHVPAHGWLRELIDKMNTSTNERKNQFVTVMSNHRLSMKFSMISYDRKSNSWTSKVFNTFQTGLANQLAVSWTNNFINSKLVDVINGSYVLNIKEAHKLVFEYDSWLGNNVRELQSSVQSILPVVKTISKKNSHVIINPTGELRAELENIKHNDRFRFKVGTINYQVERVDTNFKVSFFNPARGIKPEEVRAWLGKLGINMSEAGFNELMTNGLYHNFERVKGGNLFTSSNGLFKILAQTLNAGVFSTNRDLVTGQGNPMSESVIKSLANLESNFNTSVNSPNGRDGGKSIFGFTAPKFITDRTRDLKTQGSEVVNQLASVSFSKTSMWLNLLLNSDKFRDQFEISHIGLTAMKELGKKVYKDNSITKLSDVDHEITKLIMFWDMKQGDVNYQSQNRILSTYGDTDIQMRMATMFVPTMSDKSNMMLLKTGVLNLEDKHFSIDPAGYPSANKQVLRALYEQTVRPELLRMIKHAQNGSRTNINKYDKGAKMFLLVPEMNYIMYNDDLKLVDAIANGVEEFNLELIEGRPEIMTKIYNQLSNTLDNLIQEKIAAWQTAGFFELDSDGAISNLKYVDRKYKEKFTGSPAEVARKAAIDFEVNSMISTANSFMLYAGDPAIYFKSGATDYMDMARDTFVNVGKRLANQIAPGTTVSNSAGEKYIQVFIEDRKSLPEIPFLKFATRVNDGREITDREIETLQSNDKAAKNAIKQKYPKSAGYFEIEGADAQEYTTWREHLALLEKLGKTADSIFDITPDDIQEARELFSSWENGSRAKLTYKQEKLLGKVMQPMKPVYTGQIYDASQDVMRTVYVKSSSFPLIPQLTSGLEIDKLRVALEELERKSKMPVRASYQTANKVGSVNNAIKIFNPDGTINAETITYDKLRPVNLNTERTNLGEFLQTSSLVLDRKNFRIQQDVPFKSGKRSEDVLTLGTQLMKVLFGNGIIDADNFTLDGTKYTGKELHRLYNSAFDDLIKVKKKQLYEELGLNDQGIALDSKKSIQKLQKILREEAIGRGYPIQDIEGLNLDANGNFITPLWSSANSNRYESMLNAIVTNRLIKIKFPGNSYVVGSEEGFKFAELADGQVVDFDTAMSGNYTSSTIKSAKEDMNDTLLETLKNIGALSSRYEIVELPLTSISLEGKNAGFGNKSDDYLKASLKNNGQETPVLLNDKNQLIEGWHRYQSLKAIGAKTIRAYVPTTKTISKNDSKIVWTSKWNGKGLQGSFKKDGTIEKAQVLVASKFRNNNGELIDLFTRRNGNYVYIEQDKDGKLNLKEDMFDSELLNLMSFRIPTSGHVSGALVEIVGFLPAQNADLMIVPRNFTKQMGLDFDIDKQNTYQLWHTMTDKGTFEVLNDSNVNSLDSDNQAKLLQNKIVKIHNAVFSNPSDSIQSKINGILSTDYAEEQADAIEAMVNKEDSNASFTPLSSEYQKMKMGLGAAGKVGTGAYSLDVVFHSLVQQLASLGEPLSLTEEVLDADDKKILINKKFRFGNQVSDGILGKEMTIDGDRSIAEVLAELQNVALDNEKLQVMGRVGLNDLTIDVSKVFALLGFDKGTDRAKSSVQFLFLSQPIITDYINMMKNASSNMAEFSMDKELEIIIKLIEKYNPNDDDNREDDYEERMARRMNTEEMIAAIQAEKPDGRLQEAILKRFLEMKQYGVALKAIQTGINTDSKGLGKSFFEVIAKKEAINKIGGYNSKVRNASKLIGEYIPLDSITPAQYQERVGQGFIDIGSYLVKPTSLTGSFNVHAITTAYNMWSKHLPYDTTVTNTVYSEIGKVISSTNQSDALVDNKSVTLKQDIFKAIKKYLSASSRSGIINNGDTPNQERSRLYLDTEDNQSLASYLKEIRDMNTKVINDYIKSNKLINRFEFDINKNGQPSLIKFNNAVGEEFDEQYLYNSLSALLSSDKDLPNFNGRKYTTSMLAQDLIAYAYLGNATQEAIQFTKYVPVIYNNMVGYSQFMKESGDRLLVDNTVLGVRLSDNINFVLPSDFTIQFIQHNPERVKFKISANQLKNRITDTNKGFVLADPNTLESFRLVDENGGMPDSPYFISIYNSSIKSGEKKFQLYMAQGDGMYKRIPVLGTFGMDEYSPEDTVGRSIINGVPKAVVKPSQTLAQVITPQNDIFGINGDSARVVLENIAKANYQGLSDLARELAPYVSDVTIKLSDIVSRGQTTGNLVEISSNIYSSNTLEAAQTILHEVVHALTVQQISPYLQENGDYYEVKVGAPQYVVKLVQLYNVSRRVIGEDSINAMREKIRGQRELNAQLAAVTTPEDRDAILGKMKDYAFTEQESKVSYGVFNIKEFIALALTEPEFQRKMSEYEFKQTGMTLLQKFKQILNSILEAIGVNYSENSVTAQAINSIFELITDKNVKQDTSGTAKFNEMADIAFTDPQNRLTQEEQELFGDVGDFETSLKPYGLPIIPNLNYDNCY